MVVNDSRDLLATVRIPDSRAAIPTGGAEHVPIATELHAGRRVIELERSDLARAFRVPHVDHEIVTNDREPLTVWAEGNEILFAGWPRATISPLRRELANGLL